jgi:hypothetical protein
MANAFADQLKELGLRHGEKAGVAIASMIFLVCAGMAASTKTIELTPDQVKNAAKDSDKNLNRHEERETIIKNLEKQNIKDSNFAVLVEDQVKTALVPDNYKASREWVTPEPGAGLIRDVPELIAPTDLYAYPGRGGLLVYALDDKGNRIPDEGKKDAPNQERKGRRRRRAPAGGMGGMGGMMGGAPKKKKAVKSKADLLREQKEEEDRQRKILENKLAPGGEQPEEEKKTDKDAEDQGPPGKEIVKGYRWVAITGTLDHAKLLANYRQALKNPAIAHPNYKRLDLQRQTLQPDGTWSKWTMVSSDENYKVLDNLPEEDEELAPENVRPPGLVDSLPFMKSGLWEKVHIASLVPKEKKQIAPSAPLGGMMGGAGGRMGGGMGQMMMGGGGGAMGGMGQMMGGGGAMGGMGGMMAGGGRMGGMMGGGGRMGGMMGGGSSETAGDYWRSEQKKIMIRALDFTVEPDSTYRYKVRIVVFNPNYDREDVSANAKLTIKLEELHGPWSDPTDVVSMPPDVMPYVMGTMQAGLNRLKIQFDVIRFHPDDGMTIPKRFEAGPGELLGEIRTAPVPVSDGSGQKSHAIDFNSRQIVLDISGGSDPLPPGMLGGPIDRPGLALLLRPDGSVMVHNEADDSVNAVRKDIADNYKHELAMSKKARTPGSGYMGMGGMMGGGMMGGGMMGGGMMGGGMMGGGMNAGRSN